MQLGEAGFNITSNVYIKNNTTSYPLSIDYSGSNIFKLTNDGKITLNGIQVNGVDDGIQIYNGTNKTIHMENNGNVCIKGNLIVSQNA